MDRRGFLGAILAAGVAPAFIKIDRLMKVRGSLVLPMWVDADGPLVFDGVDNWLRPGTDYTHYTFYPGTNRIKSAVIGERLFFSPDEAHAPTLSGNGGIVLNAATISFGNGTREAVVFNKAHKESDVRIISDAMLEGRYRIDGSRLIVTPK